MHYSNPEATVPPATYGMWLLLAASFCVRGGSLIGTSFFCFITEVCYGRKDTVGLR